MTYNRTSKNMSIELTLFLDEQQGKDIEPFCRPPHKTQAGKGTQYPSAGGHIGFGV
jgi:hypothetical protein